MVPHILCVGGEDHALRIPFILALRERGFRVTAAGTGSELPFMRAEIPYQRYEFDRFDYRTPHRAAIRQVERMALELSADLVQTFDTKPGLLAPLAIRGRIPVVRTINGLGWVFSSRHPRALALRPVYMAMQRVAATWTTATVFQNRGDKALFERFHLLGRSDARLIAGSGIDIPAFETAQADAGAASLAHLRAALGLVDARVVLTVSRLTTQKGIPTLLRAARMLHAQHPDVRFVIVGPRQSEGPFAIDRAEIEKHAPYVIHLGARPDVPALLRLAEVFAFPTEYREGVPRVLLEAGLAGVPIVTTAMPGCTDVVTDGLNGYCIPPKDPRALAGRLSWLLANRSAAADMGRRSIEIVRRNFGLDGVRRKYVNVYTEILDGHAGRSRGGRDAVVGRPDGDRCGIQRLGQPT